MYDANIISWFCIFLVIRIGRTGRAGAEGTSYTFFTAANGRLAYELFDILTEAMQAVPPELDRLAKEAGASTGGGALGLGFGGGGGRRVGR